MARSALQGCMIVTCEGRLIRLIGLREFRNPMASMINITDMVRRRMMVIMIMLMMVMMAIMLTG